MIRILKIKTYQHGDMVPMYALYFKPVDTRSEINYDFYPEIDATVQRRGLPVSLETIPSRNPHRAYDYMTRFCLADIIRTVPGFRTNIRGVVNLRNIVNNCYQDNYVQVSEIEGQNKFKLDALMYSPSAATQGILLSEDNLMLLGDLITNTTTRWERCRAKHDSIEAAVKAFLKILTKQDAIQPMPLFRLAALLDWLVTQQRAIIDGLAANKCVEMTATIANYIGLTHYTGVFEALNINRIGTIFLKPKEPLKDVMSIYQLPSRELKLVASKKITA